MNHERRQETPRRQERQDFGVRRSAAPSHVRLARCRTVRDVRSRVAKSNEEPELEFWDKIPVSWDETKVLQGKPGEYIATARRKGDDWFIGTITNNDARTIQLALDFLPKGKKYNATIYSDDDAAPTKTKVGVQKKVITASTVLEVKLKASGGQAIRLTPLTK